MNIKRIAYCVLAVFLSLCCVREDLSECNGTVQLQMSYKGDGTSEIFNDKICRVELYVFDTENQCVDNIVLPQEQVAARTAQLPLLKPGDYRIVCIGNTHHTQVDNLASGRYDQIRFSDKNYAAGGTVSGNDSLYYASKTIRIEPYTGKNEVRTDVIEFASSHYDVSVEAAGIPAAGVKSGGYGIEICGVSPCTDFENKACGEAEDYVAETGYDAGKALLSTRTNIMRHRNHENVSVCVKNPSGEKIAEVNLAEFLSGHPEIDCSRHEVLIPIRIEFTSAGVEVSVPEWYIEDVKPGFKGGK